MAHFLRFIAAIMALPFSVAMALSLWSSIFASAGRATVDGMPPGGIAFCAGFLSFFLLSIIAPAPVRTYVLGHELTHALWGLAFGAKVSNIKVGMSGGSVVLSKSNVWITLAPYFFPFYTAIVALVALIWSFFADPLPCPWAWLFAVGFTWSFHVCLTLRTLFQSQPDVLEYGRLFSWSFIWIANAIGVMVVLCAATPLTISNAASILRDRTMQAYSAVWNVMVYLYNVIVATFGNGA